ncbi:hypothetical protein [Prevotella sp. AGR2160]|uniref:Cbp1 family collagen-binding glycoprotein adhesin n=1 Tax=Prevotella sp. AGR2160 TaxID=1280674 RepID=UPI00040B28DD|nr:hypothetical protein [Prevotella sp. AGR2160]
MKRLILIATLGVLILTGCKDEKKTAPNLVTIEKTDSLNNLLSQKDSEINEMLGTLNEIQDGFQQINDAEGRVELAKSGEGVSQKQQLRENISFIAKKMKQNKALIAKLKQQMQDGSIKSEALKKTINSLVKQLAEKDQQLQQLRVELDAKDIHISELDETINNLNTNVSNLTAESAAKSQAISAQDKQLNTAWFVFGTKKELKEQHILEGRRVLQSSFNKDYFTKIDIRVDKVIKLYSRSATILTSHPAGSYTLERDANKQYVLKITNPQIFWSTSKYLVVLVK